MTKLYPSNSWLQQRALAFLQERPGVWTSTADLAEAVYDYKAEAGQLGSVRSAVQRLARKGKDAGFVIRSHNGGHVFAQRAEDLGPAPIITRRSRVITKPPVRDYDRVLANLKPRPPHPMAVGRFYGNLQPRYGR